MTGSTSYLTSLYLPSSGGTPSNLNYYEETGNITLTLSNLWKYLQLQQQVLFVLDMLFL